MYPNGKLYVHIYLLCNDIGAGDCDKITLTQEILTSTNIIDKVALTVTSMALRPVHPTANRAVYHVWHVTDVDLQISDTLLSKVKEWNESPSCDLVSTDRFQNARIRATALVSSDGVSFTATNILPLIADKVSSHTVFI